MKNRILASALTLVLLLCLLAGCGGKDNGPLPDSYVPGSDYQLYLRSNDAHAATDVQEGDGVVYLCYRGYVYYLDENTSVILPLCNKADCLHNKEQDPERIEACNAYVGNSAIQYCNGYLYSLGSGGNREDGPSLVRISADGSRKDILYAWGRDDNISSWLVHRDVLYYRKVVYEVASVAVGGTYTVHAMDLTAQQLEPELIFDPNVLEENAGARIGDYMNAYGNHLYIGYMLTYEKDEKYTDENAFNYLKVHIAVYDITTGTITEVQLPDLPYGTFISEDTVISNGKLILNENIVSMEGRSGTTQMCYAANLDGSDLQPLMELPIETRILGDETYLYNTDGLGWNWKAPTFHDVYDSDLNKIDTFQVPAFFNIDLPAGRGQRLIQIFVSSKPASETGPDTIHPYYEIGSRDEAASCWGVLIWDKSKLGTYNGGEISFDLIFA